MPDPMRILIIEDLPTDAELVMREVRKVLSICNFSCVETREEFIAALSTFSPDLILSDFKLPHFDGLSALRLAQECAEEVPFIIITGSMNEDTAVDCMKAGAWDYVIKEHIKRLGPAILNALEQKKLRAERRKAEEALRASEERYRNILEVAPVGIAVHAEGKIVFANPAGMKLLGAQTMDQLIGKPITEILHPDYVAQAGKRIQRLISGDKGLYPTEDVYLRLDGTPVQVEVMATLLKYNNQPAVQVIVMDITERKKAEAERERLYQLNQAMFNNHEAVMLLIDPYSGKIIDANPAATKFYGYTKDELINMCIQEINMLPQDEVKKRRLEALKKNRKYNLFPHRLKSGEVRLVDVYTCPIPYQGEDKLYSIIFDATDRERYKEELYQEKEYLNSLIRHANAPIITWSPDFIITEFNHAFTKLTGRKREQVIGKSIELLFPADKKEIAMYFIKNTLEGEYWKTVEIPILHISGSVREVLWNSANIKNSKGEIIATIAQGMDITERKQAEKELIYIGNHDHLTGLYNRRYFENYLKQMDQEMNLPFTVVMGDVNGLKLINDSFGHETGDKLLKQTAEIIKNECRDDMVAARIGGDEYAVILPQTEEQQANMFIKSIKEHTDKIKIDKALLSISFGYATKHTPAERIRDILAEAENYMYKRKMYESAGMRNKTIDVIMNALFEKSKRELLHSKRVSDISAAIAKELHLEQDDINKIRLSGLMHDIGKIGIEENILNKKARLLDDEWLEIKKHPEAGWRILASANEFSDLAKNILFHHERWDGKGYPSGLKGEEIPIEARIITIADSYDAMTSLRSYRIPVSEGEAANELRRNAGTQFDPNIVEVFLDQILINNNLGELIES